MTQQLRTLPMVALRGLVLFPNTTLHIEVGRENSITAINNAIDNKEKVFLVAQNDPVKENYEDCGLAATGTVAIIKHILKVAGESLRVIVEGEVRARIVKLIKVEGYTQAVIEPLKIKNEDNIVCRALMRQCKKIMSECVKMGSTIPAEIASILTYNENPTEFTDMLSGTLPYAAKQALLDSLDAEDRLNKLIIVMTDELEILKIEKKISGRIKKQVDKSQKEYYLREQIKAIHTELGDSNEEESDELKVKLDKILVPEKIRERLIKEWNRMIKLPSVSPEMSVSRTYLELVSDLPWGVFCEDNNDLKHAMQVLEEDHYALNKLKERIIEYLAVRQLSDNFKSPILCLVGPPGVGKTSIVRSIARALGREYVRISLGGVHDEAEIRGHRKTYVGAMPGRIINAIKNAGVMNPVILLDEIDKIASDYRGDPSSALLEVLDPEQNNSFRDNYIEIPFDLSKVIFVTTANGVENIPSALFDRMEIIEMTGYTVEEKVQIAKRHLIGKQMTQHGVKDEQLLIEDNAIIAIIENYTRESGVRNLEKKIAQICRKVARKIVETENLAKIYVSSSNINDFLGAKNYIFSETLHENEIGVATGLAWTSVGGETLTIEVTLMQGKGEISLTGHLGDVMKESAKTAISLIRSRAEIYGIDPNIFANMDIHIHVPEGAIPKDGPSAGITLATAIFSAFSKRAVRSDVAMTGEITLRGKVLAIGGLKEKALAAHRAGIVNIIIPEINKKDLEDMPESVMNTVNFIPVDNFDSVIKNAIVGV